MKPRWSPRVPRQRLRRLYDGLAAGRAAEELIDDVGITLYLRCKSILTVRDIFEEKRLPCPACGLLVSLADKDWAWDRGESTLHCDACGWSMAWADYWATFRHQELGPGGAADIFEEYVRSWEAAQSEREKVLVIDRVIHRWHWETLLPRPSFGLGRPTGINLIEGNRKDVIAFLDSLTYGADSPDETKATRDAWRQRWQEVKERQAAGRAPRSKPG
ncbi:MAG TPA: hypothetical protein VNL16_07835 [Chloroflexota bacterium]|nr:hypothetical protein [Chloroflexota bacterium]